MNSGKATTLIDSNPFTAAKEVRVCVYLFMCRGTAPDPRPEQPQGIFQGGNSEN